MSLALSSPSFAEGQPIPKKHTGEGPDLSPPLAWGDPPAGTHGFALIADDPDAPVGTWVHWVIYGIPSATRALPEGMPANATLADGTMQGKSDFGTIGYGGPMPPPGKPHRYFFKFYALDGQLELVPGMSKKALVKAMEGHILAEGQLMGTYKR
ncbi:MAG: YbhB/YbcL family Raf kinase inhibitor-like protein [Candidatus Hydrogenedentes bacterium]|nr:YbhB/YbcL family Raf kinase inhibitor-like protein [Candidatus Hydrogenedentota bacterium]